MITITIIIKIITIIIFFSTLAGGGRAACLGEGEDTAVDCHLTGLDRIMTKMILVMVVLVMMVMMVMVIRRRRMLT